MSPSTCVWNHMGSPCPWQAMLNILILDHPCACLWLLSLQLHGRSLRWSAKRKTRNPPMPRLASPPTRGRSAATVLWDFWGLSWRCILSPAWLIHAFMKSKLCEYVTTAAVQVRRLTEELETAKNELQPLQEPLGRNWTLGISWGQGSFCSGRGCAVLNASGTTSRSKSAVTSEPRGRRSCAEEIKRLQAAAEVSKASNTSYIYIYMYNLIIYIYIFIYLYIYIH